MMKIAIIGANNFDTLEYHLCEAFTHAGHHAKIFDIYESRIYTNKIIGRYTRVANKILRDYWSKLDIQIFRRLAAVVNEFEPDLVLCVYRFIPPQFVKAVKAQGRKIVHINPDQLTTLENQQIFASDYDMWFTKDPYMLGFMRNKMNLNAVQYNEAFNRRIHVRPDVEKASLERELDIDVLSFGSLYPYRTNMLAYLERHGVRLCIFGKSGRFECPPDLESCIDKRFILGVEKARYVYGSRIVFNNLHYAEVQSVNNKFFEINGMGGFQLCDYRPILHQLLPVDPELVSFKTVAEAVSKIDYYLSHPQERVEIADRIYDHFIENYSYDHLVGYLLKQIFDGPMSF